ncbi:MAG: hypothetical protein FWD36_01170 [Treponema sp.]|nr:hypothetical protein [Treponema sp.]
MKQKIFIAVVLCCVAVSLPAMDNLFIGFSPELSAHTRSGFAVGGGLLIGLDLSSQFAAGVKLAYFSDMDTVTSLDTQAFFRYNLPLPVNGFFAQAEAGLVIYTEFEETFPAVAGGLAAGYHFDFNDKLFMEAAGRFGYPYMWGAGLLIGIRIAGDEK